MKRDDVWLVKDTCCDDPTYLAGIDVEEQGVYANTTDVRRDALRFTRKVYARQAVEALEAVGYDAGVFRVVRLRVKG